MDSLEQHREARREAQREERREAAAFLAMARRLRIASAQRDEVVRPFRKRYDRSREDLRMPPQKRVEIAEAFIQAAYRADHIYEDCVGGALETYREMLLVGREAERIVLCRSYGVQWRMSTPSSTSGRYQPTARSCLSK